MLNVNIATAAAADFTNKSARIGNIDNAMIDAPPCNSSLVGYLAFLGTLLAYIDSGGIPLLITSFQGRRTEISGIYMRFSYTSLAEAQN